MSACVPTRTDDNRPADDAESRTSPHDEPARTAPPAAAPAQRHRFRIAGADLSASIAVFLIALPLSLGIALATGAPLQAGLVAAAVGGIVAGLLGGSPLQVSGPAAGLTVVTADLIQRYGWRTTCAITVARRTAPTRPGRAAGGPLGARRQPGHRARHARRHRRHDRARPTPYRARRHPAELRRRQRPSRCPPSWPISTRPRSSVSALTIAVLLGWPRLPGRAGRRPAQGPGRARRGRGRDHVRRGRRAAPPRVDLPSWSSHALPELPEGPCSASSPPC